MKLPRFYPILDTGSLERLGLPLEPAAEALLEAGCRILQIRHKEHFNRKLYEAVSRLAVLCRESEALLVLNDRADIAVMLGCALHLGQDDLAPSDARTIAGSHIIGFSTHNEAQLRAAAAEPVDYVALGPIFATSSKRDPDPVVGTAELRRIRPLSSRPLVAIGGITRDVAAEVLAAGADSVAIISGLLPDKPNAAALRERAEEWLRIAQ